MSTFFIGYSRERYGVFYARATHDSPECRCLGQRIGILMPGRPDKWWEISEATPVDALASEVSGVIATEGAPYVLRYLNANDLVALWESGKSPGLTETQRVRYLEKLKSSGYA
jgi:hypothetical protein